MVYEGLFYSADVVYCNLYVIPFWKNITLKRIFICAHLLV